MIHLKSVMKENNISVIGLATEFGVSASLVYGWLEGRRKPSFWMLKNLRDFFVINKIKVDVFGLFEN